VPSGFRSVALLARWAAQPAVLPGAPPLLQNADVIIGIGARFDDRVTGKIALFARGARAAAAAGEGGIIQFEISSKNINKAVPLRCAGVG
jgi:thiamine pyrophosphate-dependent acetolactate synthase large subunit-like protein